MTWQLALAALPAMLACMSATEGNAVEAMEGEEEAEREGSGEKARRHGIDAGAVLLPCMLY